MSSANLVVKSLEQLQPKTLDHRRGVRKNVRLNASIVTANWIATCQVTDVSMSGCRLHLFKPLTLHQYLALEVKLVDSTASVHIPLAQVQWTNHQIAGVEFVYLSHNTRQQLVRLCEEIHIFVEDL
jgi:PilZ domain